MNRANILKNKLVALFRSGADEEHTADEMQELLDGIDFQALTQAVFSMRETVYEYRVDSDMEKGFAYRGPELFPGKAVLIYTDDGYGWHNDISLMRFRHYRPDVMLERVAELGIARREYVSNMAELAAQKSFITEDEIDATLSRGGSFEGGAGRIYSFWQQEHTPKEKADFLKHEYGTGGGNNAISHNFHSWEDHSAKGITLRKPFAEDVNLSWAKVAKRIDVLVAKDRYLTPEAKEAWEKARAEDATRSAAVNEYNAIKEAHPDEIVLFPVGGFFEMYGEDARTAARLLDFTLTSREITGIGRVEMCGLPSHQLNFYLEKLRDTQDAVVASISTLDGKHGKPSRAISTTWPPWRRF